MALAAFGNPRERAVWWTAVARRKLASAGPPSSALLAAPPQYRGEGGRGASQRPAATGWEARGEGGRRRAGQPLALACPQVSHPPPASASASPGRCSPLPENSVPAAAVARPRLRHVLEMGWRYGSPACEQGWPLETSSEPGGPLTHTLSRDPPTRLAPRPLVLRTPTPLFFLPPPLLASSRASRKKRETAGGGEHPPVSPLSRWLAPGYDHPLGSSGWCSAPPRCRPLATSFAMQPDPCPRRPTTMRCSTHPSAVHPHLAAVPGRSSPVPSCCEH